MWMAYVFWFSMKQMRGPAGRDKLLGARKCCQIYIEFWALVSRKVAMLYKQKHLQHIFVQRAVLIMVDHTIPTVNILLKIRLMAIQSSVFSARPCTTKSKVCCPLNIFYISLFNRLLCYIYHLFPVRLLQGFI